MTQSQAYAYWNANPNAIFTGGQGNEPGDAEFMLEAMRYRRETEPSIAEFARYEEDHGKVLDLGCGIGLDAIQFAPANDVTAADFSPVALDIAEAGAKALDSSNRFPIAFVHSSAGRLPFPSDTFDMVWSHGVIHHMANPLLAGEEILRVLKPGGKAVVMVYHKDSWYTRGFVPWVIRPLVLGGLALRRTPPWGIMKRAIPFHLREMVEVLHRDGYSDERLFPLATDHCEATENGANPISHSFTRAQAKAMFAHFAWATTDVRQLYYAPFIPAFMRKYVEHRVGGFLYITAVKGYGEH